MGKLICYVVRLPRGKYIYWVIFFLPQLMIYSIFCTHAHRAAA